MLMPFHRGAYHRRHACPRRLRSMWVGPRMRTAWWWPLIFQHVIVNRRINRWQDWWVVKSDCLFKSFSSYIFSFVSLFCKLCMEMKWDEGEMCDTVEREKWEKKRREKVKVRKRKRHRWRMHCGCGGKKL